MTTETRRNTRTSWPSARSLRRPSALLEAVAVVTMLFVPRIGFAQQAIPSESEVRVEVVVLSAGGERITAGRLEIESVDGSDRPVGAKDVLHLPEDDEPVYVVLSRTGSYRVRAAAPGHVARSVSVTGRQSPGTLKIVLAVDPYVLPTLRAGGAREHPALIPRSAHTVRFDREPLTYATVDEWLTDLPGAYTRRSGGGGQVLSVRGSRPADVLALLDGVPLNDPITGVADLSSIPTSTLETATLLRGAASRAFGSGASAGVLLLTSRRATETGANIGLRMESYGGRGGDLHIGTAARHSRIGLTLSASRTDNDFSYENRARPGSPIEARRNSDIAAVHVAASGGYRGAHASLRFDRTERGVPSRIGTTLFDAARAEDRSWTAHAGIEGHGARASASVRSQRLGYQEAPGDPQSAQEVTEARLAVEIQRQGTLPATAGLRLTGERVEGDGLTDAATRGLLGGYVGSSLRVGPLLVEPSVAADVSGSHSAVSPELGVVAPLPAPHPR